MITTKNFPFCKLKGPPGALFCDIQHLFDHDKAYVDIRQEYIRKGETPGTGKWHYDSFDNTKEACGEDNWLWVSGVSLTEFEDGTFLRPNVWKHYGQELHRASPAYESGERLLLRVLVLDRAPRHSYIKHIN